MLRRLTILGSHLGSEYTVPLSDATFLQGANYSGKSDLLKAVSYVLGLSSQGSQGLLQYLPEDQLAWVLIEYTVGRQERLLMAWRANRSIQLGMAATGYEASLFWTKDGHITEPDQVWSRFAKQKLTCYKDFGSFSAWQDALWGNGMSLKAKDRKRFHLGRNVVASDLLDSWCLDRSFSLDQLVPLLFTEPLSINLEEVRNRLFGIFRDQERLLDADKWAKKWEALQTVAQNWQQAENTLKRVMEEGQTILKDRPAQIRSLKSSLEQAQIERLKLEEQHRLQLEKRRLQSLQANSRLGWLQHQQLSNNLKGKKSSSTKAARELALHQQWHSWYLSQQQILEEAGTAQDQQLEKLAQAEQILHRMLEASQVEPRTSDQAEDNAPLAQQALVQAIEARVSAEAQLKAYQLKTRQRQLTLEQEASQEQESMKAKLHSLTDEIRLLEQRIADSPHALHGWLEQRYPGWRKTFGKALREDLLYLPYLSPEIDRINDLLFGVQIDLTDLDLPLRDVQSLQTNLDNLLARQSSLEEALSEAKSGYEKKIGNLEKRSKQHIRNLRKAIEKAKYAEDQCLAKVNQHISLSKTGFQDRFQQMAARELRLAYGVKEVATLLTDFLTKNTLSGGVLTDRLQRLTKKLPGEKSSPDESIEAETELLLQQCLQWDGQIRAMEIEHEEALKEIDLRISDLQSEMESWKQFKGAEDLEALKEVAANVLLPVWQDWSQKARRATRELEDASWHLEDQLRAFLRAWQGSTIAPWPDDSENFSAWRKALQQPFMVWLDRIHKSQEQQAQLIFAEVQELYQRFDSWRLDAEGRLMAFNDALQSVGCEGQLNGFFLKHPLTKVLHALHQLSKQESFLSGVPSLFAAPTPEAPEQQLLDLIRELAHTCMDIPGKYFQGADAVELAWETSDAGMQQDQALFLILGLSRMRSGESEAYGIYCVDDWDRLDHQRQTQWLSFMQKAGVQLIATGVHAPLALPFEVVPLEGNSVEV